MGPASATYVIRINGHLGATLLSAFPAMAWEQRGPETVLTGVLDQPGLYGVLAEIEAQGAMLWSVRDGRIAHAKMFQTKEEALQAAGLAV